MRIARELVARCRSLTPAIDELNQELEQRATAVAPALLELPGCGGITAAKLLAEIGPISRFLKRLPARTVFNTLKESPALTWSNTGPPEG